MSEDKETPQFSEWSIPEFDGKIQLPVGWSRSTVREPLGVTFYKDLPDPKNKLNPNSISLQLADVSGFVGPRPPQEFPLNFLNRQARGRKAELPEVDHDDVFVYATSAINIPTKYFTRKISEGINEIVKFGPYKTLQRVTANINTGAAYFAFFVSPEENWAKNEDIARRIIDGIKFNPTR